MRCLFFVYVFVVLSVIAASVVQGRLGLPDTTPLVQANNDLRCSACRLCAEQIMVDLKDVDTKAQIKMGGRMTTDEQGRVRSGKMVKAGRSEIFLEEMLENVCSKLENYTHTGWREGQEYFTQQPAAQKFTTKVNTVMVLTSNPLGEQHNIMGIQQQGGEAQLLRKLCEGVIEDQLDTLLEMLVGNWSPVEELKLPTQMCLKNSRLCSKKRLGEPRADDDIAEEAARRDKETEKKMKEAQEAKLNKKDEL